MPPYWKAGVPVVSTIRDRVLNFLDWALASPSFLVPYAIAWAALLVLVYFVFELPSWAQWLLGLMFFVLGYPVEELIYGRWRRQAKS